MTTEELMLVVAVAAVLALVVVAVAAVVLVVALRRLIEDVRAVTGVARDNLRLVEELLPPTLNDLRSASANVSRLSAELEPRLERVDALLDESEATLLSLRATVEAAEEMVRGPAAAVDRARRTVAAAGAGLARGADRLRRGIEDAAGRR